MENISLGDRMKNKYEAHSKTKLNRTTPVILRLDMKAFHTFTRGCEKPFDKRLMNAMTETTKFLVRNFQGSRLAYTQSGEITILVCDYNKPTTEAWFDYNVQKMCSVASSLATASFNQNYWYGYTINKVKMAHFDCRAFNLPKEEVPNYFYWRFLDWMRNSIQMVGQANFSHKELQSKNCVMIQEMLWNKKGINWVLDFSERMKNGTFIDKDLNELSPNLKKDKKFIKEIVYHEDLLFNKSCYNCRKHYDCMWFSNLVSSSLSASKKR